MPNSSTDNPYQSPTEATPNESAAIHSIITERRFSFCLGFAFLFVALLAIPVTNHHATVRPISTVVSLGRYYGESIRELVHLAPADTSSNRLSLFFSRLGIHLFASVMGGLLSLMVYLGLDHLGLLTRLRRKLSDNA